MAAKVKAHSAGISTLVEHDGTIVTGSSDAKLKIWSYSPLATENTTSNLNGATENGSAADSINERQVISTGKRFPLAIAMALLPSTTCAKYFDITLYLLMLSYSPCACSRNDPYEREDLCTPRQSSK